jgi:hypothetical protein
MRPGIQISNITAGCLLACCRLQFIFLQHLSDDSQLPKQGEGNDAIAVVADVPPFQIRCIDRESETVGGSGSWHGKQPTTVSFPPEFGKEFVTSRAHNGRVSAPGTGRCVSGFRQLLKLEIWNQHEIAPRFIQLVESHKTTVG